LSRVGDFVVTGHYLGVGCADWWGCANWGARMDVRAGGMARADWANGADWWRWKSRERFGA